MRLKNNKSGFTLLEIIIVIIIVGVLASLALPRLFSTVEFSRSTEALNAIGVIRQSVERCALMNDTSYATCGVFANLDAENPSNSAGNIAGSHFNYTILLDIPAVGDITFRATRVALDGGTVGDQVNVVVDNTAMTVTRNGTGAFAAL